MKNQILLLESSRYLRENYSEIFADRQGILVVSTVREAIAELQKEKAMFKRFRTNYINDDLPFPESALYARDALSIAVEKGIRPEIWSSKGPDDINIVIHHFYPELEGKIDIYSRFTDSEAWFTKEERPLYASGGSEGGRSPRKEQ